MKAGPWQGRPSANEAQSRLLLKSYLLELAAVRV
jgi:hypothetical protein